MDLLHDAAVFRKGPHHLAVIHTDLAEAESLIAAMAANEQQLHPHLYAGLKPCVYFKMPYIPPVIISTN